MGIAENDSPADTDQMPLEHQQRNASAIDPETLPRWPIPPRVPGRQNKYQVLIRRSVLNDIRDHARGNTDVEVCGVVVGTVYRDNVGPWGFIAANIRGNFASGRNAQVTFTSETWTDIHQQMEARFPKQRILGWYHSHPGFGIFLSEMDVFIHENFFAASSQVAFVDDPKSGDRGLFVWREGHPVREDFLIDEDLGTETVTRQPSTDQPAITYDSIQPTRRKSHWPVYLAGVAVLLALAGFAIWWLG
jgi:proteasome lid subunit RPN8/RPN11